MGTDFLFKPPKRDGVLYGVSADTALREAFEKKQEIKAKKSYDRGLEASAKGEVMRSWIALGYAARLLPGEPHFAFAYALSCLNVKASGLALERMTDLLEKYDYRGAAFGRISALFQLGDFTESIAEMGKTLARFTVGEDIWDFACFLAKQGGFEGACGFTLDGRLWLSGSGKISLYLDGHCVKKMVLEGGEIKISLPPSWKTAQRLLVRSEKKGFLGGVIDLLAMRRMKSLAWHKGNHLFAWVEYAADPEYFLPPVWCQKSRKIAMMLQTQEQPLFYQGLGSPSVYKVPLGDEAHSFLEVEDAFQRPLWGSPVPFPDLKGMIPACSPPRKGKIGLSRDFVIILPVYGQENLVKRTLSALLKTLKSNPIQGVCAEIIVVNDASPQKTLKRYLRKQADQAKILLLENEQQQGFAGSVNRGLELADGRDVILFNSDAVAFEDWAVRLLGCLRDSKAGTATPFGNSAGQMSFPLKQDDPVSLLQARSLDRFCAGSGKNRKLLKLPTGNGFCMAISAECLAATGGMREGVFAQAYGEEVDFCLRAAKHGFEHVAAANLYVFHEGGRSVGHAGSALFLKNQSYLERLHPDFRLKLWQFEEINALERYRRTLAEECLQKKARKKRCILLISHAIGGGVTRYIAQRLEMLKKQNRLPLLLIPTKTGCRLGEIAEDGTLKYAETTLSFALPEEQLLLIALLRRLSVQEIEYHNVVGHADFIRNLAERLEIAPDIFLHDHASFCPHTTLISETGHYCGEPDVEICGKCACNVAKKFHKKAVPPNIPDVSALLESSLAEMRKAKRVFAPSADAVRRFRRHFPEIRIEALPPEDDQALFQQGLKKRLQHRKKHREGPVWKIGIVGALSEWKGALILEEIARSVQELSLPIQFVLVGHAVNETALLKAGVEITGAFQETEIAEMLSILNLDAVLLPSIAPETWGYTFSHVIESGLFTFCFDIGSVPERLRALGEKAGFVLPLGFPPERIGHFLIEKLQKR